MYNKILVPLDGTNGVGTIFDHIVVLARCSQAEVLLLYVEEPPIMLGWDEVIDTSAYHQKRTQQRKKMKSYLAALQEEFIKKDVKAQIDVVCGTILKSILRIAGEERIDLIAMATRDSEDSSHAVCGSLAGGLLKSTNLPLLLMCNESNK